MSLEDSFKERVAMWRREHDIIYNQLPVLLEKMDILFPAENMENSEPENKSETKNLVAPLPAVTPEEIGERYKDLEESIRGFIKDLDEAEKEEEEDGGTSEAASPSFSGR
uniref:Uncharacterized protein n=1 Tax=Zea mays TaxID=4577 RepID=B6TCQ9_MAIZE|nr:hypothetical protein [Zea mays]